MRPHIGLATSIVAAGVFAIILGGLCLALGARINTSRSIPVGLYWVSGKPVEKGSYVLLCPPRIPVMDEAKRRGYLSAGFCPGDYGYMMKRVAAMGGDVVAISSEGVRVNQALLPLSAPLDTDRGGRRLPRLLATRLHVGASEVLLMSDVSGTSFDGRYFGPVSRAQIKTVIVPVFTW